MSAIDAHWLVEYGLLDPAEVADLETAPPGGLLRSLIAQGVLDDRQLAQTLSQRLALPLVGELELSAIPAEVIDRLSAEVAVEHAAIPIRLEADGVLRVAMLDPTEGQDEVSFFCGGEILRAVAPASLIEQALFAYYDYRPLPSYDPQPASGELADLFPQRRTDGAVPLYRTKETSAEQVAVRLLPRPTADPLRTVRPPSDGLARVDTDPHAASGPPVHFALAMPSALDPEDEETHELVPTTVPRVARPLPSDPAGVEAAPTQPHPRVGRMPASVTDLPIRPLRPATLTPPPMPAVLPPTPPTALSDPPASVGTRKRRSTLVGQATSATTGLSRLRTSAGPTQRRRTSTRLHTEELPSAARRPSVATASATTDSKAPTDADERTLGRRALAGQLAATLTKLRSAADRESAGRLALEFLQRLFDKVALLRVRRGVLSGWAVDEQRIASAAFAKLWLPLDSASAFAWAVDNRATYRGPLRGSAIERLLSEMLGTATGPEVMIIPLLDGDQARGLIYGEAPQIEDAPAFVKALADELAMACR